MEIEDQRRLPGTANWKCPTMRFFHRDGRHGLNPLSEAFVRFDHHGFAFDDEGALRAFRGWRTEDAEDDHRFFRFFVKIVRYSFSSAFQTPSEPCGKKISL